MSKRMIFPIVLGLLGAAVFCALGVWQLQRLAWKAGILNDIESRISAEPDGLPSDPREDAHEYMPVEIAGSLEGPEIHVLTSIKGLGPGYRVIQKLVTLDGRNLMADLGFVPVSRKTEARPLGALLVSGNLLWPNETDAFISAPNLEKNIWFARDNDKMAEALNTDPVLVVVQSTIPKRDELARPVRANLPNDHLQYAITWFALMLVWLGMSLLLAFRVKRRETEVEEY